MSEIKRYDVWDSYLGIKHEDECEDGEYCLYSEVETLLKQRDQQLQQKDEELAKLTAIISESISTANKNQSVLDKHRELMGRMAANIELWRKSFNQEVNEWEPYDAAEHILTDYKNLKG